MELKIPSKECETVVNHHCDEIGLAYVLQPALRRRPRVAPPFETNPPRRRIIIQRLPNKSSARAFHKKPLHNADHPIAVCARARTEFTARAPRPKIPTELEKIPDKTFDNLRYTPHTDTGHRENRVKSAAATIIEYITLARN